MNDFLESFTIELGKSEPAYQQIEQHLRQAIRNGDITKGGRLPTMSELSKRFDTSIFTIQTALKPLIRDGILDSAPKRGIRVQGESSQLRRLGICQGEELLMDTGASFYQELYKQLRIILDQEGIQHKDWLFRVEQEQGPVTPEMMHAIDQGQIQGIIIPAVSSHDVGFFEKVSVPLSLLSSYDVDFRTGLDSEHLMQLALSEIKRQGCRTVGMISALPAVESYKGHLPQDHRDFFAAFHKIVRELGLECRERWLRTPSQLIMRKDHEFFGYQQFGQLWRQEQKPQGLVVYSDTVVRGVVMRMLKERVSVPEDIKPVFHRNQGVNLLCPYAASWLVSDVHQIARSLIEQLRRQVEGKKVRPQKIPFALEIDEGLSG